MQKVRRSGTGIESTVGNLLRECGLRARRNAATLPGRPDFVVGDTVVVFVHGCFWHGHSRCKKGRRLPRTNRKYWAQKIQRNARRDDRCSRRLRSLGFAVFTVWECELRGRKLPERLLRHLRSKHLISRESTTHRRACNPAHQLRNITPPSAGDAAAGQPTQRTLAAAHCRLGNASAIKRKRALAPSSPN
jgi:DNA mismatch endonuclease, patch repair protein